MNTLATRHPASRLSPQKGREPLVRFDEDRQGSLFLMGSAVLHVGLLVAFAWMPTRAHASSAAKQLVEIDFVEQHLENSTPPPPETEIDSALPMGRLDAPLSPPSPPRALSPSPSNAASETPAAARAPEILTTDNPYASADAAVFTSGSALQSPVRVVKHVAAAPQSFGVEEGSSRPSPDNTRALHSWYAKVQAQLATMGTRNYPRRALKLGQQGTAKVTVTIDEAGNLIAARLAAGSGVPSLDEAALQGVQSISKVTAPPSGSGTNQLTVPVTFRIN